MTQLETVLKEFISLFRRYAKMEGDATKLNRSELHTLLQDELSGPLGKNMDSSFVAELMKILDTNKDGEVDLKEFGGLIGILACGYTQNKE